MDGLAWGIQDKRGAGIPGSVVPLHERRGAQETHCLPARVSCKALDSWGLFGGVSIAVTTPSTKAASSTKAPACTLSGKGRDRPQG